MEEGRKKIYHKPKLSTVHIDRDIALVMETPNENEPINPPFESSSSGSTATSSDKEETTKENNFDENPFER